MRKGRASERPSIGKDSCKRGMVKKAKKEKTAEAMEGGETLAREQAGEDADRIEELMRKLAEKEKEAAENYDRYVRAAADLENYRKRAAREKADCIKYGQENLIRDILWRASSGSKGSRLSPLTRDSQTTPRNGGLPR